MWTAGLCTNMNPRSSGYKSPLLALYEHVIEQELEPLEMREKK